ncbi:penicillin-binding protein 1A [Kiloniella sp. b19]|uniref:penicillin-binding protein 1A n=1 Tax=Kiloniella sp. GXU_MW_B19 TaxID=3141326 RepID=UPI0031D4FCBD
MKILKVFGVLFAIGFVLCVIGAGVAAWGLYHYGRGLPDYRELAEYMPPTVTRVHAGDGRLLEEYATEKRVYVPVNVIPRRIKDAFMAAEDKNFYEHFGINPLALARAVVTNIQNIGTGRRLIGASTITQQVAKNFLLTNETSIERKIKEAILSFRIEQAFTKDHILDLYLNEIFLGYRSYGVAAAAQNYFNKSLDELSVAEAAYLGALPKAPNNYHPVRRHAAALERRNWVIGRMLEDGRITQEEAEEAWQEPLVVAERTETEVVDAPFFAEEVRRELENLYGEQGLYEGGLSVHTTVDPQLQEIAQRTLREGLEAYDRRHGWRGALGVIDLQSTDGWKAELQKVATPGGVAPWELAAVIDTDNRGYALIGLKAGGLARIPMDELKWARPWIKGQKVGAGPKRPSDVLTPGDVVLVEALPMEQEPEKQDERLFALRQIPGVNGGLVALDPHTGRVLAMSGGFAFGQSQFNRATQARRQPGSVIKPFIYLAGLDNGYTPASIILDAPFALDQGVGLGKWKPKNYSNEFFGPTRMRVGVEKSRNLMTVRLAQDVGMDKIVDYVQRFGIDPNMEPVLSMALGAGETTLLNMTTAYAQVVNGGKDITPSFIDRIQDRYGKTIYLHDQRPCADCQLAQWDGLPPPELPDTREQLVDPVSAYQLTSILEGVVQRGTGRRIAELGKPLGGKTGTTNDSKDTWFVGFSPDLAVGVYIGFDNPIPLGNRETGSSVAAPVFKAFMKDALADAPPTPFRVPSDVRLVRINTENGLLARPGDRNVILEAFKPGTVPSGQGGTRSANGNRGGGTLFNDSDDLGLGGGLY